MKKPAAAYCVVVYDDYTIDIRPMPNYETARAASDILEQCSTRIKHTIAVVGEVCRNLPEEAIASLGMYSFKKLVSQAIKNTAQAFSVAVPTINDKLTRKCGLRMDEFVALLYSFLSDAPANMEEHPFWQKVILPCSIQDMQYAHDQLSKLFAQRPTTD